MNDQMSRVQAVTVDLLEFTDGDIMP